MLTDQLYPTSLTVEQLWHLCWPTSVDLSSSLCTPGLRRSIGKLGQVENICICVLKFEYFWRFGQWIQAGAGSHWKAGASSSNWVSLVPWWSSLNGSVLRSRTLFLAPLMWCNWPWERSSANCWPCCSWSVNNHHLLDFHTSFVSVICVRVDHALMVQERPAQIMDSHLVLIQLLKLKFVKRLTRPFHPI